MTNADYTDDLALLANAPAQAKSQMCSLKQAARDIDVYINANKTEIMYFKQEGAIPTLSGNLQKLVEPIHIPW